MNYTVYCYWIQYKSNGLWPYDHPAPHSLIVAILSAIRWLLRMFRDQANREGDSCSSACLCICECLIGCIESLMEYFNKVRWMSVEC